MSRARLLAVSAAALLLVAGCGTNEKPVRPEAHAKPRSVKPDDVSCANLRTRPAAHRLARKLVDRVVAPEHQRERETIGIIGESLYATCRQPHLPGVTNMAAYRPVKPVLA